MQTVKKRFRPDSELFAEGEAGILTKLKNEAEKSRYKRLKKTFQDSPEVKELILQLDILEGNISTQPLINRQILYKKHIQPLKARIYRAVIKQGYVSKQTMKRFRYTASKLVVRMTYRGLLEGFLKENVCNWQAEYIKSCMASEAQRGRFIDIHKLSDEYYTLLDALKELKYIEDDELTKTVTGASWLKLDEIKNRDQIALYNERSKIENLCYHIFNTTDPITQNRTEAFNSSKFLGMGTTNLELIVSYYVKKMNELAATTIKAERAKNKNTKQNQKYQRKKDSTANEKRENVQKAKLEGKTQSETMQETGYKRTTVQKYWN